MPIKGLSDRRAKQQIRSGRTVRLGTIGKGERTGFGKNIRLVDHDYFVFKPEGGDRQLADIFAEVYGKEPKVIDDVRIPVGLAGNFDIEECAWLTAARHTKSGSTFMARSDGENVVQARDPATGKVEFHREGERSHEQNTALDSRGKPGYTYGDKVFTWQQSFAIDLILPDFNRALFEAGAAGLGTVTLMTHSTYDISGLIAEYDGVLNELTNLLRNPLKDDYEMVRRWLPLRDFPLRLFRSVDKITTPNYHKDSKPGDRLNSTRSLLHWSIAPGMARGIQVAIDKRTQNLIEGIASAPMLKASNEMSVDETNDLLYGKAQFDDPAPRQIEAKVVEVEPVEPEEPEYKGPDWEETMTEEIVDEPEQKVDQDTGEILEGSFDDLNPQVEDARAWLTEKFDHGKVTMSLVAQSLVMTPYYNNVDDVKGAVANAPEFEGMRAMGLSHDLRKKYTAAGGTKIFDIAVKVGAVSIEEEE